jgi:hypothetical protein
MCAMGRCKGRARVVEYWMSAGLSWVRMGSNPQTLMKQRTLLLEWLGLQMICKHHREQHSFRATYSYVEARTCIHSPLMINLKDRISYTVSLLNLTLSHSQTFNPQPNFKLNLIRGTVLSMLRVERSFAFPLNAEARFQPNESVLRRFSWYAA